MSVDRGSFKEITGFSGADFLSDMGVYVRDGPTDHLHETVSESV